MTPSFSKDYRPYIVIPAKAGIPGSNLRSGLLLDPRFRGGDDRALQRRTSFLARLSGRNRKKEKAHVAEGGVPMMRLLLIAAAILLMHEQSAKALLLWNWIYSGTGVSASGTFTTNDAPDPAGFSQIVGITGTVNGATITGLQPTGTPIPGNEPYAVDNLVSAVEPRLTAHWFGFSLANGDYANPFYNSSNYYEHLSVPPYVKGAGPERPVSFSAAIVPEPSAASLMLAGLSGLIGFGRILNRRTNLNRYPLHRLGGFKGRRERQRRAVPRCL